MLLLLADGRFPAGGHAHSGGLEAAVALEGVRDIAKLECFLRGRAETAGAVAAAFAAATCAVVARSYVGGTQTEMEAVNELDHEFDCRIPSPVLRAASRRLGRQILRAGRAIWPHALLDALGVSMPGGVHQPVVLGAVSACAGLGPAAAAAAATHVAVRSATAAFASSDSIPSTCTRPLPGSVLGSMPLPRGSGACHTEPADLPAWSAPLLDLFAEQHATWEVRLFAS